MNWITEAWNTYTNDGSSGNAVLVVPRVLLGGDRVTESVAAAEHERVDETTLVGGQVTAGSIALGRLTGLEGSGVDGEDGSESSEGSSELHD